IRAGDTSEKALAAYKADLKDFNNIIFPARIGVRKGGPKKDKDGNLTGENWDDKNCLAAAIGPEHKDWHPVEQLPPFNGGAAAAPLQGGGRGASSDRRACSPPRGLRADPSTEMGAQMKKPRTVGEISLSALEDEGQRRATAAAIAAMRGVVQTGGTVPPLTPV